MKIKVNEATLIQLNWMVAKCLPTPKDALGLLDLDIYNGFNPTTEWSQGGPIIEREKINITMSTTAPWMAFIYDGLDMTWTIDGPTPLIAAMRCYVASKLGDEVDVPDELI